MTWLNKSSREAPLLCSNIKRLLLKARVKTAFSHHSLGFRKNPDPSKMHGWIFQTRPRFNWCPVHQRKRQVSVSQRNTRPLLQQLETGGSFLEYKLSEEGKCLLDAAISFVPSGATGDQQSGGRSRRAIEVIAAVTACGRLVSGEPLKSAACNALSVFNICKNNNALSRDVDNITRP